MSDVGARYAPAMEAPKGKAMAIRPDFERAKLAPSGGPFHVRVALRSSTERPSERPHLSVHLVLDVSGSMAGESITNAREAARSLVDKLAPNDDFSLVTFSNDAEVKIPDGPVGARRDAIKKTIAAIKEGSRTNIGRALNFGYAQAQAKSIPADAVRVVLLLSDGHANMGITAPDRLSKLALDALPSGVQTSAFGLGPDYDGALMSAIAAEGAGGYYYLRDAQQIAPALATEIDKRLDPVATAVEVRVRLKKDVSLLRVYGSRQLAGEEAARVRAQEVAADAQAAKRDKIAKDRQDDTEGGMRFFMPGVRARRQPRAALPALRARRRRRRVRGDGRDQVQGPRLEEERGRRAPHQGHLRGQRRGERRVHRRLRGAHDPGLPRRRDAQRGRSAGRARRSRRGRRRAQRA